MREEMVIRREGLMEVVILMGECISSQDVEVLVWGEVVSIQILDEEVLEIDQRRL